MVFVDRLDACTRRQQHCVPHEGRSHVRLRCSEVAVNAVTLGVFHREIAIV